MWAAAPGSLLAELVDFWGAGAAAPGLGFVALAGSQDPDFQAIRIIHPIEPFYIFNIYNGYRDHYTPYTLDRLPQAYPTPLCPSLIVGNFNLHHP